MVEKSTFHSLREINRQRDDPPAHNWLLESPRGRTSKGICGRCGRVRRFPNAFEDTISEISPLNRFSRSTKMTGGERFGDV